MNANDSNNGPTAYGAWPSPISAAMVASAGIDFGGVALDGGTVYWREQRPSEDGRGVVVRADRDHEDTEEVTPEGFDVRTLVHEYGGGDFAVHDGTVFFSRYDDQRVYRQSPDGNPGDPVAITPSPGTDRGLRYADFELSGDGGRLYCVREDHDATADGNGDRDGSDEPVTTLVRLSADGGDPPRVVASGHDFYAAPRLSPDGEQLAWLTWDHPGMPWDGTELHVGDVTSDGEVVDERVVMGGPDEAVFQPAWRPDGVLHAVSDPTGWWNLYRREVKDWVRYREESAEYGVPHWVFGLATYEFLDDGRVAAVVVRDGEQSLELLDPDGSRTVPELPYESFGEYGAPRLRSDGESLYFVASGPAIPPRLVRWAPDEDPVVLRRVLDMDLDPTYVSTPDHVAVPTRDGQATYALVYPPTNPDVEPPGDESPPLVAFVHGGPTSARYPRFALAIQFFTSRGFAVAEVNYRGSTGYGRAYREALYGDWGIVDVARSLADQGRVDGERMAVSGGSAGGFVVLSALAFHDAFAAGKSQCGVADLGGLAELTHKFESRYLDQLVGPYPEDAETYRARSPVEHADGIEAPLLLLQGEDDPIVPLSQAEAMAEALDRRGVPNELIVFEDERHSFRRADSRRRAIEAELSFYGELFGFEPADEFPNLDLCLGRSPPS